MLFLRAQQCTATTEFTPGLSALQAQLVGNQAPSSAVFSPNPCLGGAAVCLMSAAAQGRRGLQAAHCRPVAVLFVGTSRRLLCKLRTPDSICSLADVEQCEEHAVSTLLVEWLMRAGRKVKGRAGSCYRDRMGAIGRAAVCGV